MPIKFKVKSKGEVQAESQSLYVERAGGWMLEVDGVVDRWRLEECRANNIAISDHLAQQQRRFEGNDPDEVRKLAEEKQQLEQAHTLRSAPTAREIEKLVEGRLKTAKTEWDKQ